MKTVEEFIKEIESSETLPNVLKGIKDKDALSDFLKKNDVGTTAEEFRPVHRKRDSIDITVLFCFVVLCHFSILFRYLCR